MRFHQKKKPWQVKENSGSSGDSDSYSSDGEGVSDIISGIVEKAKIRSSRGGVGRSNTKNPRINKRSQHKNLRRGVNFNAPTADLYNSRYDNSVDTRKSEKKSAYKFGDITRGLVGYDNSVDTRKSGKKSAYKFGDITRGLVGDEKFQSILMKCEDGAHQIGDITRVIMEKTYDVELDRLFEKELSSDEERQNLLYRDKETGKMKTKTVIVKKKEVGDATNDVDGNESEYSSDYSSDDSDLDIDQNYRMSLVQVLRRASQSKADFFLEEDEDSSDFKYISEEERYDNDEEENEINSNTGTSDGAPSFQEGNQQKTKISEEKMFADAKRHYRLSKFSTVARVVKRDSFNDDESSATNLLGALHELLSEPEPDEDRIQNDSDEACRSISEFDADNEEDEDKDKNKKVKFKPHFLTKHKLDVCKDRVKSMEERGRKIGISTRNVTTAALTKDAERLKFLKKLGKVEKQLLESFSSNPKYCWNSVAGSVKYRKRRRKKRLKRRDSSQSVGHAQKKWKKWIINDSNKNLLATAEHSDSERNLLQSKELSASLMSTDVNNHYDENIDSIQRQKNIREMSVTVDVLDQLLLEQENEISQLDSQCMEYRRSKLYGGAYHELVLGLDGIDHRLHKLQKTYIDSKYDVCRAMANEDLLQWRMAQYITEREQKKSKLTRIITNTILEVQALEREIGENGRLPRRRCSTYSGSNTITYPMSASISLINSRWNISDDNV